MAKTIIRFSHATFGFHDVLALKDISLEVSEGEFVGVIGPNGSGKTTLCRAVLGLLRPLEGSLQIFDCACEQLRCHHRARIGYLPQKGALDRNFPITVLETVMMGRYGVLGLFHRPRKRDREIALEALVNVGMQDHRDTALGDLSGGQQQRVLIARARSEEHTSELQSRLHLVCRLLLEKKKKKKEVHTQLAQRSHLRVRRKHRDTPLKSTYAMSDTTSGDSMDTR